MKILVSIISCTAYRSNRLRACLDTWGKDIDDLIIFSGEFGEENKPDDRGVWSILKAAGSDDYNSNVDKIAWAIKYLPTHDETYDWYIFLDDDTYLNYKNLVLELEKHSLEERFIMGDEITGCFGNEPGLKYCSGGGGIVMNRGTLEKMINFDSNGLTTGSMFFGDVAVGRIARSNEVSVKNNTLFHGNPPNIYEHDNETIRKQITYHKLQDFESMNKLHNIIIQK